MCVAPPPLFARVRVYVAPNTPPGGDTSAPTSAPTASPLPEDCLTVSVSGCEGTLASGEITGSYELFDPGTIITDDATGVLITPCNPSTHSALDTTAPVYYSTTKRLFLYKIKEEEYGESWVLGDVCGPTFTAWISSYPQYAYLPYAGGPPISIYPFLSPDGSWKCAGSFSQCNTNLCDSNRYKFRSVSIQCSHYDDPSLHKPCDDGTYHSTGKAPDGKCTPCPARLERSRSGRTSVDDCYTLYANLYILSEELKRFTVFNTDSKRFNMLAATGEKPTGAVFISNTICLVSLADVDRVVMYDADGDVVGDFAQVTQPMGLLYLSEHNLIAVASGCVGTHEDVACRKVFFFDYASVGGEMLTESDAVGVLATANYFGKPNGNMETLQPDWRAGPNLRLRGGENPDEILIVTRNARVLRMCIPSSAIPDSTCDVATRNRIMMKPKNDGYYASFTDIAVLPSAIPSEGSYLLVDNDLMVVHQCPFEWVYGSTTGTWDYSSQNLEGRCTVFADLSNFFNWDPQGVEVDLAKELVYISDTIYSLVHVFLFDGTYKGTLTDTMGDLLSPTVIALRPAPLPSLSSLTPTNELTAGVPYSAVLTLLTSNNAPLPPTYPISTDLHRYQVTASGLLPGTNSTFTIDGNVAFDRTSSDPSTALTASVSIDYAGDFTVTVTEGIKSPQTLHNAPFQVTVRPAQTDPASCVSSFPTTITAGESFAAEITPFDSFSNPTLHPDDSFSAYFDSSPSTLIPLTRSCNSFTFSSLMTIASSYRLYVLHGDTEVAYSPFNFDVKPAAADVATTTHNIKAGSGRVSSKEVLEELRLLPKDQYNNTITDATGYAVSINGGPPIPLLCPDFSYTHSIPKGFEGELVLNFTLDGEYVKDSPVTISVEPARGGLGAGAVMGIVVAFISVIFLGLFFVNRQKMLAKRQVKNLRDEQEGIREQFSRDRNQLESQNMNLRESLRKKKHSEDELAVMKEALQSLEKARKDELDEVLINSAEVRVSRLLGKGGFGVVNLATYRGRQTAMKQLLTIDDDSVKRFRYVRHTHVVLGAATDMCERPAPSAYVCGPKLTLPRARAQVRVLPHEVAPPPQHREAGGHLLGRQHVRVLPRVRRERVARGLAQTHVWWQDVRPEQEAVEEEEN